MADFSWKDKHISSHPRKETWDTLKYRSHQSPTCWINNFYWCYLQQYEWGLLTGAEIQKAETPKPTPCISGSSTGWKVSLLLPGIGLVSAAFSLFYFAFRQLLGKKTAYLMLNRKQRENKRGKSGEKSTLQIQIPFEPLPPMGPHLLINAFTSPFMDSSTNGVSTLEIQQLFSGTICWTSRLQTWVLWEDILHPNHRNHINFQMFTVRPLTSLIQSANLIPLPCADFLWLH